MSRYVLAHDTARQRAIEAIQGAPEGYVVTILEPTRKEAQSSKFHAICTDIAKSGLEFAGKRRDKDTWKLLLISAHAHVTRQGAEVVAGLEGEWLNIRESSASMGVKRMASLIEYSEAYAVNAGVRLGA